MKWDKTKIRLLMESNKITQVELARGIHVSSQLFSYYLNSYPTIHNAEKVIKAFKRKKVSVSFNDIVTE